MATATPKKFSMQQTFEILLRRPATKQIVAYLTDTKTTSLENTMELVYPSGGAGNVYIGGGFAHSKRATMTVENATFNTEVMALQNGTEVANGSADITKYEILTAGADVASDGILTSETAKGTTNEEIGYAYIVANDGTFEKELTQSADASAAGQFKYEASTKKLTFFTGDVVAGDRIAVAYTYASADTAQKIVVASDGFPSTVLVSAYGVAKDVCSGETFPCVVEGTAQVDGNWNFDLTADGDPVVQNLNLEFVRGCLDNQLYNFVIYTDEDEEGD